MIVTILPGSSDFHAVGYNERKVSKGVARLLEMQNFGALGTFSKPTPDELVKYLQEYTSRNSRIRKAQYHVAFSCKGHDRSESEMLEFAAGLFPLRHGQHPPAYRYLTHLARRKEDSPRP